MSEKVGALSKARLRDPLSLSPGSRSPSGRTKVCQRSMTSPPAAKVTLAHLIDAVETLAEPGCAYVQGGEPPARSGTEKTGLNGERRRGLAEGESHDVTVAGRTKPEHRSRAAK